MTGKIRFWHVRVAVLLGVLVSVLIYAWLDVTARRERTEWRRTLQIAMILVEHEPIEADVIEQLRLRLPMLERRLEEQAQRYLSASFDAFDLHWIGSVPAASVAPLDVGDGWLEHLSHAWRFWRYTSSADEAAGLEAAAYDARLYLAAYPATGRVRLVEGVSQQGGRLGVVRVELADDMVDFALIVAAHELFHTLGATDRYDVEGRTLVPEGLAEPELQPVYPQRLFEIMARNRPIGPIDAVPPEDIAELSVGALTAREIGWTR